MRRPWPFTKGSMAEQLYYDLHLHSCLSPCGDNDMTPANIAGMAALKGLDVIALTDHNSCRNCPALLHAAADFELVALPGMELCTMEEVHVLCLFSDLTNALNFDAAVYPHILPIDNDEALFGQQIYYNENDAICGTEPRLLISATDIPFADVFDFAAQYHGVMIPAHIDKSSTSLLSNLGFVPLGSQFPCFELRCLEHLHRVRQENPYLTHCTVICDSDAHYLEHIHEPEHTLLCAERTPEAVLAALAGAP